MSSPAPIIISLVSGKGGVGKTMLSVAVARELSLSNRTLIVDLDFFNRGLTGLMGDGPITCEIDKPGFLLEGEAEATIKWNIVQVAENLFHIEYPDLLPEEMQRFGTLDVNVLKNSLQAFVHEAAEKCNCTAVVLDCHGGPDNSSFAACLFSDYSILVSEPDRITFYGTLNFLRQLKRLGGDLDVNLHLAFNKTVPAFSGLFLRSLYNRLIKEHFGDRPLLAIFPLEVYLTKEFEKTPFLTDVYPDSLLARKTRTLLYDLLAEKHRDALPSAIGSMPGWMRGYTRLTLGKQFPILNMNVVMSTIVIGVMFVALLMLSLSQFFPREPALTNKQAETLKILQCMHESTELRDTPADEVKKGINPETVSEYELYEFLSQRYRRRRQQQQQQQQQQSHSARDEEEIIRFYRERSRLEACIQGVPEVPTVYESRTGLEGRKKVLDDLRPELVLPEYRDLYERTVNGLRNKSRLYLVLQKISDVVSSSTGSGILLSLAAGWLALVLLVNWSSQLNRRFSYHYRLRRFASMLTLYAVAVALWFFPLLFFTFMSRNALRELAGASGRGGFWFVAGSLVFLSLILITLAAGQLIRVYRDARYEGHYLEDTFRAVFALYLLLGPLAIYFLFMR